MSIARYAIIVLPFLAGCSIVDETGTMPDQFVVYPNGVWLPWLYVIATCATLLLLFAAVVLFIIFRMRHYGVWVIASIATLALACSGIYFTGHVTLAQQQGDSSSVDAQVVSDAFSTSWPGAVVAAVCVIAITYLTKNESGNDPELPFKQICEQRIRAKDIFRHLSRTTKISFFLRGMFEEYAVDGIKPDEHARSRFPKWWRSCLLWWYDSDNHQYDCGSFRNVMTYHLQVFHTKCRETKDYLSQLAKDFSGRVDNIESREAQLANAIRKRIK